MKIYFAGSIRGGRDDAKLYKKIITYLRTKGHVLTEHVGDQNLGCMGEKNGIDRAIYQRDIEWLESANAVVAEVTTPSLGVGYELGVAEKLNKQVLCLYRPRKGKNISAMIKGNRFFLYREYNHLAEVKLYVDDFIKHLI